MPNRIQPKLGTDTAGGRFAWFLEKLWHGSRTDMAKAIGVHSTSIAHVVLGRRPPGRELLTKLSAHPLVNERWLLHGVGTPLRSDETQSAELGLPIASVPFAGLPSEHPDLLEDALYPVSRRLHRPSRYWFRIDQGHPLGQDEQLQLRAGDCVLFEPDPAGWPKDLAGKPCLARFCSDAKEWLDFGRCLAPEVTRPEQVHLCGDGNFRTATQQDLSQEDAEMEARYGKRLRNIDIEDPSTRSKPTKSSASDSPRRVEVVAVGIFRCGPC